MLRNLQLLRELELELVLQRVLELEQGLVLELDWSFRTGSTMGPHCQYYGKPLRLCYPAKTESSGRESPLHSCGAARAAANASSEAPTALRLELLCALKDRGARGRMQFAGCGRSGAEHAR